MCHLLDHSLTALPTPTSIRVCLKPPPAPTMKTMPAIGPRDFSTVVEIRALLKPAARPSVSMPSRTAASSAISGEPMKSKTRWGSALGSSITTSTRALPSIRTTGSRIVASTAPKLGVCSRFSASTGAAVSGTASGPTQRSATRAKSGPATIRVGTAISRPRASVTPRSACSASTATSGPGCGGTRPCSTERPASAGMPTRISGRLPRRATSSTIGISRTTPTSKNSGRPRTAAISAIAHGSALRLERARTVSAMMFAPPESASSLPSIAPRPISRPTPATVAPKPVEKLVSSLSNGAPATTASRPEPRVSARNGCSFSLVISSTMAPMLSSTATSS